MIEFKEYSARRRMKELVGWIIMAATAMMFALALLGA